MEIRVFSATVTQQNIQRKNWKLKNFYSKPPKKYLIPIQHLINPRLRFSQIWHRPQWCALLPYTTMWKLRIFNEQFLRKCIKTQIFNTYLSLIPGLSFFSKFRPCHSSYFIHPHFNAEFQKKGNERSLRYLKTDLRRTMRAITKDAIM